MRSRAKFERLANFWKVTGIDEYEGPSKLPFASVSGIASSTESKLYPTYETEVQQKGIRFFFKNGFPEALATVEVGDILECEGIKYEISQIDIRGVLPGGYPNRIVGEIS